MLGIVQVDELQLLQAQQAQAALDAAPHLRAGKDAGLQIAVGLRCQHEARRKPAKLAEHDANATLALTIAVGSGGIQEVEGTRKESTNRGQGALLRYFVAEGLRHTPQRSCANTDRRHLQASRAKRAQCQWLWSFCLRRHSILLSFAARSLYFAVQPPSMTSPEPVTNAASSEAR